MNFDEQIETSTELINKLISTLNDFYKKNSLDIFNNFKITTSVLSLFLVQVSKSMFKDNQDELIKEYIKDICNFSIKYVSNKSNANEN